jgi:hypothetical protein
MSNDFEQESFKKLPRSQVKSKATVRDDIGEPVAVDDLDGLPVSERVRGIIRDGYPEFEPDTFPSASEARMAGIVGMIQAGVEDEAILGVLLDPQYAIHKRSNGVVTEQYGRAEIERAHKKMPNVSDDFSEDVDPKWLKDSLADKKRRERFKGMSMDDLRKLPPLTWLVEGLIGVKALFELYGPRKAGKTFLALDMGLSIASGREWHGKKIVQGRVLHIVAEGNIAAIRDRVDAWTISRAKNPAEKKTLAKSIVENWRLVGLPVHIDIPETLAEFMKANPGNWDFIIVDTMLRNMAGHISDPKDMAAFVRACDTIRERTGAAVMVVHHEGKDKSKGGMGSMVFDAAVDGIAKFHRQGAKRVFSVVVLRDADDSMPNMIFELEGVPLEVSMGDDGDKDVRSAVLVFKGTKAKKTELTAAEKVLLAIYEQAFDNQADLAATLGVTKQAISKTLNGLREQGYLPDKGLALTPHGIDAATSVAGSNDDDDDDA